MQFTDDHGIKCSEMRLLPYSSDGNILVSRASYDKEMRFRKDRIKEGVPYELPAWETLKIYGED